MFEQRSSDGREFVSRECLIRTRGDAGEASRSVDVVASTGEIDSHGTILDQETWDLARYAGNPVVLYAHNRDELLPIGSASNVRVENGELLATLTFASKEASPLAEQVWRLIQEKVLRAVSVGFYCRNYLPAKVNDVEVYILSGLELIEISVVPIGSNPGALTKLAGRSLSLDSAGVLEVFNRVHAVAREPSEVRMGNRAPEVFGADVLRALKVSDHDEALGAIVGNQTAAARAATLEAENTALRASADAVAREAVLSEAKRDGRLTPAMEKEGEFAAFLASAPLATVKAALKVMPVRSGGSEPLPKAEGAGAGAAPAGDGISDTEREFIAKCGITVDAFKAQKARDAAQKGAVR